MKSLLRTLIILSWIPCVAACDDYRFRYFGAVNPSPVVVHQIINSPFGRFRADSTIISIDGVHGCDVGMRNGDTRTGVQWRITTNPGAILLEQDLQNWQTTDLAPFSGVINGQQFNARASSNGNFLRSTTCLFRGSTLSGHFSSDFSRFDATEDMTFGQIGSEVHVQRHWLGTQVADQ